MSIYLCSTVGEIRHRLAFPRNPLDILQIVNLYQPQSWVFRFHFDATGRVSLDIEFGGTGSDPFFAISSGLLGAFDCDRMKIHQSGAIWECDWRRGLGLRAEQNVLEYVTNSGTANSKSLISLSGFTGGTLPQQFSKWEVIAAYLHEKTWFGSYALQSDRFAIEFAILGNRRTFKNHSLNREKLKKQESGGVPTVVISQSLGVPVIGEAYLLSSATDAGSYFRWTYGGLVSASELRERLGLDISGWEFKGELEIAFPSRQLGPDGTIAMDDSCRKIVAAIEEFGETLDRNTKMVQFRRECLEFDKKSSARRIDQRKDQLLKTKFVFFNNRLVYKIPTNEMEMVSLHQKLEGMGGLPFASFVSLEYTPKLGIDAIVDFMISDIEAIHRFATVEFEYKFDSFFLHAHPVEQTDMIICWEGARPSQEGAWDYQPDPDLAWLGYLHVNGKVIRVAQASKYPGLEFKGMER